MPKCSSCGAEVTEEMSCFCPSCGVSLRSDAITSMIEDARRALNMNPNDLAARYNLALAYKLAGMTELAVNELVRVSEAQPDFADVHYVLYLKTGRVEEAKGCFRRVLELEPEHPRARKALEG